MVRKLVVLVLLAGLAACSGNITGSQDDESRPGGMVTSGGIVTSGG